MLKVTTFLYVKGEIPGRPKAVGKLHTILFEATDILEENPLATSFYQKGEELLGRLSTNRGLARPPHLNKKNIPSDDFEDKDEVTLVMPNSAERRKIKLLEKIPENNGNLKSVNADHLAQQAQLLKNLHPLWRVEGDEVPLERLPIDISQLQAVRFIYAIQNNLIDKFDRSESLVSPKILIKALENAALNIKRLNATIIEKYGPQEAEVTLDDLFEMAKKKLTNLAN